VCGCVCGGGSIDFLCEVTVVCVWMAVHACVCFCGLLTFSARFCMRVCVCVCVTYIYVLCITAPQQHTATTHCNNYQRSRVSVA